MLNRRCHIVAVDVAPGSVADRFVVRIQEPAPLAILLDLAERLQTKFGFTTAPVITGIEISIDAYPKTPNDKERARLLIAMQCTILTKRDIWTEQNSRPRTVYKKTNALSDQTNVTETEPAKPQVSMHYLAPLCDGTRASITDGLRPDRYLPPALDGTMYLGAKADGMMIRLMDKIIDEQKPDGSHTVLPTDRKRVRVEVTLQGQELTRLGLTDLASLETFSFSKLQGDYFQFKLPSFENGSRTVTSAACIAHNMQEEKRKAVFRKSGIMGLMYMDAKRRAWRALELPTIKSNCRAMGMKMKGSRVGTGITQTLVSYEAMNQKMALALRDLGHREARAFKKRRAPAIS